MKALVITGSRADRNGLEVVYEALLKAGHDSRLCEQNKWDNGDVAVIGGDRIEILEAAVDLAKRRIPIAHIAGGDVTEGSADDRYRDAISKLACIHFATNHWAESRLRYEHLARQGDAIYETGSPAIDRIKQTPVYDKSGTFIQIGLPTNDKPTALVCVHPNTVGQPLAEFFAVKEALSALEIQCIVLGANADPYGDRINESFKFWCATRGHVFAENVSPQLYYSLLTHCDVMVGNSSAMLYEAPSFGLPCVLVGDRQNGRIVPDNVLVCDSDADEIVGYMQERLQHGRISCENPYGDGDSAPRIVKALEENSWRWSDSKRDSTFPVKHAAAL
jgi:UDP-hydrolysing UDP-N-acetyl-D-glucosamine 2-epimerase